MDGEAAPKHDIPNGLIPTSFEPLFRAISLVSGPEDPIAGGNQDVVSVRNPNRDEYALENRAQHYATSDPGEVEDVRNIDDHGKFAVKDSTGEGEEAVNASPEAVNSVILSLLGYTSRSR